MTVKRERIFSWMARFSHSRSRRVIWAALIVAGLCAFSITRLPFESDVLNLLPGRAPVTGDFVTFLREFGSTDSLYIVMERKSGKDVEPVGPFAGVLAERLWATGEFSELIGRPDPESREKLGRQFLNKALLYLPPEDLAKIEERLSDQGIDEQIRSLKMKLASLFSPPLAAYDPLDLLPLFQKNLPLNSLGGGDSGYLVSADGKMLVLVGRPKGSAPDIQYDENLVQKMEAAEKSARRSFAKTNPAMPLDDLKVGWTGGYVHALEDSRLIKKELLMNFLNSLAGVILLVFLAFRSGISLFYAFFPLLVSPLLTLGLFCPFLGRLSEATGAFSAIILGLSIDFIILLYARFLEENEERGDIPGALERTLTSVGPGVFTGAVTTTAAYYALLISDFRGVRELGFLTGTGILVSMLCAFFLFPALAAWREGRKPGKPRPISSFGLEKIALGVLQHPAGIIFCCSAVTLVLLWGSFRVRIDNDPERLRPAGNPSTVLEKAVQEKLEGGLETVMVLGPAETPEKALELQASWKRIFEEGQAKGVPIARFEDLAQFLPPLSRQEKNLEWMTARGPAFDPDRVEKKIRQALQAEALQVDPFEPGLKALKEMLSNREVLTWQQAQATPLKAIEGRFLKNTGTHYLTVAYLHVRPEFWSGSASGDFLAALKKAEPGTRLTSPRLVQRELETLMSAESWKILLLALAAVCLLVYLDFRSWPLTFISLLPVALASIWTLGLMGFLGMNLNFMNLVVFTMVLGIGVDYGVHIIHRGLRSSSASFRQDLNQVGKGVILAGLTTLWGFGSLYFSSYPGLRSMGMVAIFGVGFSLLNAMTLVVVLLQKWKGKISPQKAQRPQGKN